MKILIADDSVINLRVLEKKLAGRGHEFLCVQTGAAAWQALQAPDGPTLALLDWMMSDVSGLEICRRVRAWESKRRVHLIMVTCLGSKPDMLEAFAAGADDYIVKPYDPDVLVARVEAATRILEYQAKLQDEIRYRDSLLQPPPAAGSSPASTTSASAASPRPAPAPPAVVAATPKMVVTAGSPHPGASPSLQQVLNTLCPLAEVGSLVGQTLAEMGLGDPVPVEDAAVAAGFVPEIGVVHFIIMPDKSAWLDLLLETDHASALALYQLFAGVEDPDVPEADLVDVIAETLNMIQGKLKAVFQAQGTDLLVPAVPQSIPPEKVAGRVAHNAIHARHLYSLPGMSLRFTLYAYFSPVQRKRLHELTTANVLAEPLRPMDNADLVIINKGTMLNKRALQKVANLAEFAPRNLTHPIIEPSPLMSLVAGE